jgi:transposase
MTGKRKRREFTPEYKAEVVGLFRTTDKSIGEIARELDLTPSAVQRWVHQAEVDAGNRRENRILREERDILKRARLSSQRRPGEGVSLHCGGEGCGGQRRAGMPTALGLPVRLLHLDRPEAGGPPAA